ncbi:MAG: TonB-dependent receptor [Prevotella sp.]|nr:TonB-dependent receptor [Prevotella sp.]
MRLSQFSIFNIKLSLILLLSVNVVPLSAREVEEKSIEESLPYVSDSITLHQVVVTGTRTPKTLADTPVLTRIITSKDIERSDATDIQELLKQEVPGVEFSYAMNQQTHLNFAGFGGQSILFLVDGERLAGETLDDVDFSRLVMADVERIEIVKGASSALYGSSAGGGVINIITKEGGKAWSLHLDSRWSRHHGQRYGLQVGRNSKRVSNLFTSTFSSVDTYSVTNDANPVSRVYNEVYGNKVVNVRDRLSVKVCDKLKLMGRVGYYFRQVPRVVSEPERYRDLSAGLKASWQISSKDLLDVSYSFDQYDKSTKQQAVNRDIRTYSNVQNAVRALFSHVLQDGSFIFGADFMRDYLYNTRLTDPRRHQYTIDAFAQYDWNVSSRLELVGALRYDYISDGKQSHVTPKFSMRYNILTPQEDDQTLTMRFGYGMGFRSPTLKEKYSSFDMAGIWTIQGNPNLKSELSHNFNLALSYARSRYSLMLMGFCNTIHNKITTGVPYIENSKLKIEDEPQVTSSSQSSIFNLQSSSLILPYINIDRSTVYGMEVMACAQWGEFKTTLGYTLTKENYDLSSGVKSTGGGYLPTRPHTLALSCQWDKEFSSNYSLGVALNGRFLSSVESSTSPVVPLAPERSEGLSTLNSQLSTVSYPAYTMWKLSVVNHLWQKVKVTLALDNLFNYRPRYYYLNSPATDGTNFMLGLSVDL